MKKSVLLFGAYLWCVTLALAGAVHAAPGPGEDGFGETGFVVLQTTGNNADLRSGPGAAGKAVAKLPPGVMLLAEAWTVADPANGTAWYAVAEVADGSVADIRGERTGYLRSPLYVDRRFVEEIAEDVPPLTPVVGYGEVVDSSPASQRRMVERQSVKSFSLPGNRAVPAYTEAFPGAAPLDTELTGEAYGECDLVALADQKPGWLLIVDRAGRFPSGWVEAGRLRVKNHPHGDGREAAYLVALTLGANVPEIMRNWGPGRIAGRTAEALRHGISATTTLVFKGLSITYRSQRDFAFTLTRAGAGLGGIFIGADWCDKDYIGKNFGKLIAIEKSVRDDATESWTFGGGPDNWNFRFHLVFDAGGLVNEFRFNCAPANRNG